MWHAHLVKSMFRNSMYMPVTPFVGGKFGIQDKQQSFSHLRQIAFKTQNFAFIFFILSCSESIYLCKNLFFFISLSLTVILAPRHKVSLLMWDLNNQYIMKENGEGCLVFTCEVLTVVVLVVVTKREMADRLMDKIWCWTFDWIKVTFTEVTADSRRLGNTLLDSCRAHS